MQELSDKLRRGLNWPNNGYWKKMPATVNSLAKARPMEK